MPPLAAILIYAVAAAAQWQGHGSRARHAALDAALTAYPEIHARETDDAVRAAMACPATAPMASPFSATGDPCPCFFAARCPAPASNFSRQLVHYGFAPDTGRASKHHSYEDHGSKPECPGLHE